MRPLLQLLGRRTASERNGHWHRGPQFHQLLRRERIRSDRTGSPFAVVSFTVAGQGIRRPDERVVQVLAKSRRATDEVGWLRQHPAALLPATDAEGAEAFAARIRRLYYSDHTDATCPTLGFRVFPYPYQEDRSEGRDGPRGAASSAPDEIKLPSAELRAELSALFRPRLPLLKRSLDIVLSSLLLILVAPLILTCAFLIGLTSPGPVFFCQQRVGLGGRLFPFYKLRTMVVDADQRKTELDAKNEQTGPVFKMDHDPRITPIGRWLRKLSIDELPQLWNVLRGDMSLVGPRPPTPDEVLQYEPWQYQRLETTGGLTCFWQVQGRSKVTFEDWVRMDIRYIDRQSLLTDLRLLVSTVPAVITARGAQ